VDDQADNLRVLAAMLLKSSYHVRKALSGKIALTSIQAIPPDLILLDINMPEMNGYEVCRQLKSDVQTRSIPVIFISALDHVENIIQGFAVGGADYIAKPFNVEEVLARVKNQLTIQRLQRQLERQNQSLHLKNAQLQQEIHDRQQVEAALRDANQKLLDLACLDSLTGIANRRKFDLYFHQEWLRMAREQQPLSLVLCDLDYFKPYNDTYGHLAGDVCLRLVAQAISRVLRRPGDELFRYGGEEFAIVLPNTDASGAMQVAQNIQDELQSLKIPHRRSQVSDRVTASIGVASQIPHHSLSPEFLFDAADSALYAAKERGRNTYCVQSATIA
jgi:diguanylate cyclase (GGDEF)-like protein